jgi:Rps23 Pro-64 3,4-dihydroxylase Tpa1-like proline 4-hydroxylase
MCLTYGPLRLVPIERFTNPFDYFTSYQAFTAEFSRLILDWLETHAPWKLVQTDFYEQYEFSFWNVQLPTEVEILIDANLINHLRQRIGTIFDAKLSSRVDIAAHRLTVGQRIRLHNDYIAGKESHRVLVQLNRGWTTDNGGLLMLFNSSDPADIHKIFRPVHNTAIAFAISPNSNHAVSTIQHGDRFTLVFSFFPAE